jgi:hypothetical protein
MTDFTKEELQSFVFFDSSKLPMDIICNNFSVKDTLLGVLDKYNNVYRMDLLPDELSNLATEIPEGCLYD